MFWFRFIFRNSDLIELKRFDVLKSILQRDYDVFSGFALESYFKQKFIEEQRYTRIGNWWDRRGENEIDLVCEDALTDSLAFFEVKRDKTRISMNTLMDKTTAFFAKNPQLKSHKTSFNSLSLDDM
jgi:AAA+ ATPase superfamily predicted ATPase